MLYKLFSELEVKDKMSAMLKALYTDVQSICIFQWIVNSGFPFVSGIWAGRQFGSPYV